MNYDDTIEEMGIPMMENCDEAAQEEVRLNFIQESIKKGIMLNQYNDSQRKEVLMGYDTETKLRFIDFYEYMLQQLKDTIAEAELNPDPNFKGLESEEEYNNEILQFKEDVIEYEEKIAEITNMLIAA